MSEFRITSDATRTIIRQEQEKNQENEHLQNRNNQQQQERTGASGKENEYYYNYHPARARAREADAAAGARSRELPGAEIMQRIAEAYHDNINRQITAAAAGIIERALRNGMEPETVILAIEETGMASRPSPYYLSAVLRNWAENGVVLSKARGMTDIRTTEAQPWWR